MDLLPELDREHLPCFGHDDFQLAAKLEAEASISEIALASDSSCWGSPYLFSDHEVSDEDYLANEECVDQTSSTLDDDEWSDGEITATLSSVHGSNTASDKSKRLTQAWKIDTTGQYNEMAKE